MRNYKSALGTGIRGTLKTVGLIAAAYATLYVTDLITNFTSQKITSQKELERIVNTEKETIGYRREIGCKFVEAPASGVYDIQGEDVLIVGGFLANRKNVKHELCHLYNRDHDERQNDLLDWIHHFAIEEPKAILYANFGLKL